MRFIAPLHCILCGLLLAALGLSPSAVEAQSPERVIVVTNSADPQSEEIGRYYLQQRGIPESNRISLPFPLEEEIPWKTFVEKVYNPLQKELVSKGFIQAVEGNGVDAVGRQRLLPFGHRIDFLVLARIPVKIAPSVTYSITDKQYFQTDGASVDGELALLMASDTPLPNFLVNPLFGKERVTDAGASVGVIRTMRLDGPDAASVKAMIDSGLYAEKYGLRGRAAVDKGGRIPLGDEWLDAVATLLRQAHFPLEFDAKPTLMGWTNHLDSLAFYFGWWTTHIEPPFSQKDFRFAPGAIAFHMHSFSAIQLRVTDRYWSGPLIARGAAFTFGNAYEPYLAGIHQPHAFLTFLLQGRCVGEAAWMSQPALSWMSLNLGDPLYRPFRVPLEEQLEHIEDGQIENRSLCAQVLLRQMQKLQDTGDRDAAIALGQKHFFNCRSLSLAYGLALLQKAPEHLSFYTGVFLEQKTYKPHEIGLVVQMAFLLERLERLEPAFLLISRVLEHPGVSRETLLPEAERIAQSAGQKNQATLWRQEIEKIKADAKAAREKKK